MKVSIITPVYNGVGFIEKCIESIRQSSYGEVEHIIVDAGSTDGTREVLDRFGESVRWLSEPDEGIADAMNKGVAMATGDIVGQLNSDETYHRNSIETVVDHMQRNPDTDVVYGDNHFVDPEGRVLREKREIDFDRKLLVYLCYIQTIAAFFRKRTTFDAGILFDKRFKYAHDKDYFNRLAAAGKKFVHIRQSFGAFTMHSGCNTIAIQHKQHDDSREITEQYMPPISQSDRINQLYFEGMMFYSKCRKAVKKLRQGCYG
ncbi:MAG: glycosyltransferase family 2 protein [Verrucomicrobia bacterium]|nr:glycosyltransferase family 2 protein [Verrucomicrobiota bacterium]MDA1087275.1 glycosyltransferase family 2 protein [Verrucomicrobiota bacterium]